METETTSQVHRNIGDLFAGAPPSPMENGASPPAESFRLENPGESRTMTFGDYWALFTRNPDRSSGGFLNFLGSRIDHAELRQTWDRIDRRRLARLQYENLGKLFNFRNIERHGERITAETTDGVPVTVYEKSPCMLYFDLSRPAPSIVEKSDHDKIAGHIRRTNKAPEMFKLIDQKIPNAHMATLFALEMAIIKKLREVDDPDSDYSRHYKDLIENKHLGTKHILEWNNKELPYRRIFFKRNELVDTVYLTKGGISKKEHEKNQPSKRLKPLKAQSIKLSRRVPPSVCSISKAMELSGETKPWHSLFFRHSLRISKPRGNFTPFRSGSILTSAPPSGKSLATGPTRTAWVPSSGCSTTFQAITTTKPKRTGNPTKCGCLI